MRILYQFGGAGRDFRTVPEAASRWATTFWNASRSFGSRCNSLRNGSRASVRKMQSVLVRKVAVRAADRLHAGYGLPAS